LSTKEQIIQDIIFNEVILRPKPLLDQLAEGLKTLDVLAYIRAFPSQLEPLLVHGDVLCPNVVKSIIIKPCLLTKHQEEIWQRLMEYVEESTTKGEFIIISVHMVD